MCILVAGAALAQSPGGPGVAPRPEGGNPRSFEVVSIKRHLSASDSSHAKFTPGRYNADNVKVRELIQDAFDVRDFQISGAPGWAETEGFDITATTGASADVTAKESELLIRVMLVDRFHLRFHSEVRDAPVYALIVAKGGPQLVVHSGDDKPDTAIRTRSGIRRMTATRASMLSLATTFSRQTGRPVLDKTGLSGEYDVELEWALDPTSESAGPSIFTAIQEKLGLKLQPTKGPVEMIVIDGVERPSGD